MLEASRRQSPVEARGSRVAELDAEDLRDERSLVKFLSGELVEGTLTLFIGAGASHGLGLPLWDVLVGRLLVRSGLGKEADAAGRSADELQTLSNRVRIEFCQSDASKFAALVSQELWSGISDVTEIRTTGLLTAIGALVTPSWRGGVTRVVTLNYDDFLERYLERCGMVVRVVSDPPGREGSEDVRIYHPHGFLPHPRSKRRRSSDVVLDSSVINRRLADPGNEWMALMRHIVRTGTTLFVGMSLNSFRDRAVGPLLLPREKSGGDRSVGCWVVTEPESETVRSELGDSNVTPVFRPVYDDIPGFLYSICQAAAEHRPVLG